MQFVWFIQASFVWFILENHLSTNLEGYVEAFVKLKIHNTEGFTGL
jgi:hypothetical protein